jgi:hypothetical protein
MCDMTKTLMKSCANVIAILSVVMLSTSPQAANEEASAEKAAESFDHAMLAIFHRSQKELTANARPIMIISRDVTVVSKDGEVSYPRNAPHYDAPKSEIGMFLAAIDGLGLSKDALADQRAMFEKARGMEA